MSEQLEELERRVGEKWGAAVAARTPTWPVPDVQFDISTWADVARIGVPAEAPQFPREQFASYPAARTVALILADRLLDDAPDLTEEQWVTLNAVMLYGGKTRLA